MVAAAKSGNLYPEVGFLDRPARPHPCEQDHPPNQFARMLDRHDQHSRARLTDSERFAVA